MKLACSRCGQMSQDGHLWCQLIDCPAGDVPTVFTYGDYIGDIKIIRLLRLFRTAAIYEAEWEGVNLLHGSYRPRRRRLDGEPDNRVMVKVAHSGSEEILKKEAMLLAKLAHKGIPGIPRWLPPMIPSGGSRFEPDDEDKSAPKKHGKAVFRGETKYYLVLDYIQGTFLRDLLYENPEPWYRDAAYITIGLSQTLSALHKSERIVHANISPDVLLITRGEKTRIPRPTLLDLGVMYSESEKMTRQRMDEIRSHVHPAYMPPEMIENYIVLSLATDVYGLGILMYEMMAGAPAYEYTLRNDGEIIQDVESHTGGPHPLVRRDVARPERLDDMLMRATANDPGARFQTAGDLRDQLTTLFGEVPTEPSNFAWSEVRSKLTLGMLLAILLVIITVIVMILLGVAGGT